MFNFHVPSGIGDVSWLYSKLINLPEKFTMTVADGWPHRTAPFLNLLPRVERAEYGPFNYDEIIRQEEYHEFGLSPTWRQVFDRNIENVYIECNRHLESGRRLEDWLPDLPTNFHYPIYIPFEDADRGDMLIRDLPRPIWAISAASYRGSEAWKTWGFEEWKRFLTAWHLHAGGTILLLGGFWDDLTHTLASNPEYKDIVGKTSVGAMLKVIKEVDGYIGFSSGMGILRTVYKKPVFMLWPDHQVELSTSWAPPEMLENGQYIASLWRDPAEIFQRAKIWHRSNFV
jgi:hypothetical protein